MVNMSYCKFRNVLSDLREVEDFLDGEVYEDNEEEKNPDEEKARRDIIELCKKVALKFEEE